MMSVYENVTRVVPHINIAFLSDELLTAFNTINLAILAGSVSTFGIVANVINIVIFLKQGFSDTVNISLLALAVSDLCSLLTLQLVNLVRNPLFIHQVPLIADEFQHLTGGWPHACFARITSWITMYITFERCLCVVMPLKVKRIVRPKVAISVLVSIFLVMILTMIPDYATCYIGWKFVPARNRSALGLIFLANRNVHVVALSFSLTACTQISSFLAIILFTTILVVKMKQSSKWRLTLANNGQHSLKGSQKRDNKTVKMIILIAVIYCICLLTFMVNCITTSIEPEFVAFGLYHNFFFAAWSFGFLVESINSSVNIFIYYSMSSKYRLTFQSFILNKT